MRRSPQRPCPPRKPSHLTKTRLLRTEALESRDLLSGTDLCWSGDLLYAALKSTALSKAAVQSTAVSDTSDSYVASAATTTNYGNVASLSVSRDAKKGTESQAFLRFNTSQVSGVVTSAVLKFTATQWTTNDKTVQLRIRMVADANDYWVEGSGGTNTAGSGALTYSNRPQADGAAITIAASAWPAKGSAFSVDVTSLVQQTLNTNGVATFVIDIVSATGVQSSLTLASREYTTATLRPTLTLTTTTTPTNQAPTVAIVAQAASTTVTGKGTTLTVLGADDAGESNLRYTWSATSLPSGAAAPTFSVNGTNAAKSTGVTFSKAGTYTLKATITDADGLSVTSTVSVTVAQTLSGLSVSPGTVLLQPGATQTFAAAGVDQFGTTLTSLSNVAWTSSAGTITSAGILTAPTTTGTVTVTATSGVYRGSATVTVAIASFLGIQDAALGSLTQSLDADGSISRLDMIQILRSVGSDDGVVDAVEFADLKTIITNAAALKMASYVETLARDVVYGSVANTYYQGTALGNLAAGSSSTVLTKLVDKWFLGADHPGTTIGTYTLSNGTLFVNGPSHTDMDQGQLGDCYFISSMGSLADASAAAVQNMFIDNGDNTWTVRFYAGGVADYVTVDRYLPASSGTLVYAGYGMSAASTSTELWIPLAEKAYAQWNETGKEGRDGKNLYSSIASGWMADVYGQVLGKSAASYSISTSGNSTVLANAMTNKFAVTIGTISGTLSYGLYGNHAYDVIGYNSTTDAYTLYNPWGTNQPTASLTYAQLQTVCDWFAVADASGTVAISQTRSALAASTWAIDEAYAALGRGDNHAAMPSISAGNTPASQRSAVDLYYQQA